MANIALPTIQRELGYYEGFVAVGSYGLFVDCTSTPTFFPLPGLVVFLTG